MEKHSYQLGEEFQDGDLEAQILSFRERHPRRWQELGSPLAGEDFVIWRERWEQMEARREGGLASWSVSGETTGPPIGDEDFEIKQALHRLRDLSLRRKLAALQQNVAMGLYGGQELSSLLEEMRSRITGLQASLSPMAEGKLAFRSGACLAQEVIVYAQERLNRRRQTGQPVTGILTGLTALDRILNGLNPGLHVLAAGPGAGKTTLALQMAWVAAANGHRCAYVTYENSAANLMLKLLCAQCGLNPSEIERGLGDASKLEIPLLQHRKVLERLCFLEGGPYFALQAVEADLLIFDYLQRAAHGAGYEQLRHNVSAMTGQLREWAMNRKAAVLAISSLNRSAADYGRGGAVSLENLKESGDLEYGADTVMLLYPPSDSSAAPPARDLELRIAKNRFGPVGQLRLVFRPDLGVFRERLG